MRGVGVKWVRTITRTYDVAKMRDVLKEALTTKEKGPKVIVAQSECTLNKQRRVKPLMSKMAEEGKRVVRERFGVDEDTCTGDHSCIRLSGCPSLTIKPTSDPLRKDPVATVIDSCVGCGLCGEVAHAAVLCPSFFRADIISNPTGWERFMARLQPEELSGFCRAAWNGVCRLLPFKRTPMDSPLATAIAGHEQKTAKPTAKAITIAIIAMGGEGGGVLADWIVDLAEHANYYAQNTSVPGVAQRTGSTVYYIEIFPELAAKAAGKDPVLALMPVPGELDVVLASELMEAGRAVQRGFVTPDRTTLIASTDRVYSMTEKTAIADGQVDEAKLIEAGAAAAKKFVYGDFSRIAQDTHSVISASLFGALAATGALPFHATSVRRGYRARRRGREIEPGRVCGGICRGGIRYCSDAARRMPLESAPDVAKPKVGHDSRRWRKRVESDFPGREPRMLLAGISRCADFQDEAYAADYLRKLETIRDLDRQYGSGDYNLLRETGRYLALWMTYEDAIRVADLKIRRSRFDRVRKEVRAGDRATAADQRVFASWLAGNCGHSSSGTRQVASSFAGWPREPSRSSLRGGKTLRTTSLGGFWQLYMLASLRPVQAEHAPI